MRTEPENGFGVCGGEIAGGARPCTQSSKTTANRANRQIEKGYETDTEQGRNDVKRQRGGAVDAPAAAANSDEPGHRLMWSLV